MGRRLLSLILTICILLMMPLTVSAQGFDPDHPGSITVTLREQDGKTPASGLELSLYYVASVELNDRNKLSYVFTEDFEDCGCDLDSPVLTSVLDNYVKKHAAPVKKQGTNTQGTAKFTDLPLGLYFVKQTNIKKNDVVCTSFLVTVPNYKNKSYVYDVNASPKTEVEELTDITIKKVWNTDASTKIPNSVTVQLLRGDAVVETATLNEKNDWQQTYPDMPESDSYKIVEVNIPKGFTATYSRKGYVFTVTNTAALAQTGQLIWPIPVLAVTGLFLIVLGTVVLRKTRDENA